MPRLKVRCRVFVLIYEGSCHTIIFANVLRHDLDLDSVVLDTCVVILTYAKLFDLYDSLSELSQPHSPQQKRIHSGETPDLDPGGAM